MLRSFRVLELCVREACIDMDGPWRSFKALCSRKVCVRGPQRDGLIGAARSKRRCKHTPASCGCHLWLLPQAGHLRFPFHQSGWVHSPEPQQPWQPFQVHLLVMQRIPAVGIDPTGGVALVRIFWMLEEIHQRASIQVVHEDISIPGSHRQVLFLLAKHRHLCCRVFPVEMSQAFSSWVSFAQLVDPRSHTSYVGKERPTTSCELHSVCRTFLATPTAPGFEPIVALPSIQHSRTSAFHSHGSDVGVFRHVQGRACATSFGDHTHVSTPQVPFSQLPVHASHEHAVAIGARHDARLLRHEHGGCISSKRVRARTSVSSHGVDGVGVAVPGQMEQLVAMSGVEVEQHRSGSRVKDAHASVASRSRGQKASVLGKCQSHGRAFAPSATAQESRGRQSRGGPGAPRRFLGPRTGLAHLQGARRCA
mmetsp:Transcript_1576/g.5943  ORF Transcript_1576/g.5943 Transcript_1576/m.5943 type:complete len:422 (-) Transcript_1576:61-1326(-)